MHARDVILISITRALANYSLITSWLKPEEQSPPLNPIPAAVTPVAEEVCSIFEAKGQSLIVASSSSIVN